MLDVLIVDDEPAIRMSVSRALLDAGHRVTEAEDGAAALEQILARVFDVAVFDIRLPKVDGLTLFRRLHTESPSTVVILMTAHARVRDAVEAIRGGAHDYVTKPFDPCEFVARVIAPIAERQALRGQFERARAKLTERDVGTDLVGCSPFAARVRAEIDAAAQSNAPLLIRGERGTGKRLVARLVHDRSPRRNQPYVLVPCASLPKEGGERALFGTSLTDGVPPSSALREGYFAAAQGGTLMLDDVGAMPATCQALVAAAIRDGAAAPPNAAPTSARDVRVIATTHEDLESRGSESFREELLSKLKVLEIVLSPLRDRGGDLELLFEYFIRRESRGIPPKIAPRAWEAVASYPFRGNVEELQSAVRHALAVARGAVIDLEHLPSAFTGAQPGPTSRVPPKRQSTMPSGTHVRASAKALRATAASATPATTASEGPLSSRKR